MARPSAFRINIDATELERFGDRLDALTPEEMARLVVGAINETVDSAYDLGRKTMLRGVNLTDDYLQRKMQVEHASANHPTASITAFGGSAFLTSLSHYGAVQLTSPVNWSNERILGMGKKFGPWPGWTQRTGNPRLAIPVGSKADGRSVEVVKGRRKRIGPAFAIPGKMDADGNPLVFRRNGVNDKIEALLGPSVYQLFKVAAGQISDQVADELQQAVIDTAERKLREQLT